MRNPGTAVETISADHFVPLQGQREQDVIARPSIGYWQHVWLRFKRNRVALVALAVVAALLLFAIAGPWVWRDDPAAQSIGSRSLGPTLQRKALVVTWQPWLFSAEEYQDALADPAVDIVTAAANTEYVRLWWREVDGAARYEVYRSAEPDAAMDAEATGLPLDVMAAEPVPRFEDRLDLRQQPYTYIVLALDERDELLRRFTLVVEPELAIALMDAQLEGLVPVNVAAAELELTEVTLPAHPLGTDHLGRDILARLMYGGRISLFIGVAAPLLYVFFGALYGGIAGFLGGRLDDLMMRAADFVVALPFLLFMILFRVLFGIQPGESGITAMLVAMIVLGWPSTARLVRGQVLQLKELAFVNAAQVLGARPLYIILTHMLPNVMGVLLVSLTFAIPSAIFTEAFLSFIGLGVAPPAPSWGSMCNDGIRTMLSHPHELLFPAIAISLAVLAFNLLGDALRDAFDIKEGVTDG